MSRRRNRHPDAPAGLLFVIFLILKLTGVITWSWLWVTAPLWGPVAVGCILFLLAALASPVIGAALERRAAPA